MKIGFYFTGERSSILLDARFYKAPLVEAANEDTRLCFLPRSFNHKAPDSSLTCYFSPKFAKSQNSSIPLNNLLHFSLEQKGAVINQKHRTCDGSGTRGKLAEFAFDGVVAVLLSKSPTGHHSYRITGERGRRKVRIFKDSKEIRPFIIICHTEWRF